MSTHVARRNLTVATFALLCSCALATRQDTDEDGDELEGSFAVDTTDGGVNPNTLSHEADLVVAAAVSHAPAQPIWEVTAAKASPNIAAEVFHAPAQPIEKTIAAKVRSAFSLLDMRSISKASAVVKPLPGLEKLQANGSFILLGAAALLAACLLCFFISVDAALQRMQADVVTTPAACLTMDESRCRYKVQAIAHAARTLATACTYLPCDGDSEEETKIRFVAVEPDCRDERRSWSYQLASWRAGRCGFWPHLESFMARMQPDDSIPLISIIDVTIPLEHPETVIIREKTDKDESVDHIMNFENPDKAGLWHDTFLRVRNLMI